MIDLEKLTARASIIRAVRAFFTERGYLELDTPALSPTLIPETCLEVFKTELIESWSGKTRPLYLVPSPEIYMKKIIAEHKVNVFQISKCYRNGETREAIHNPEFTMLEYYTMNASYRDSAALTEELFTHLGADTFLSPPFTRMTMDDAFESCAGFRLSETQDSAALASHACSLGIAEPPGNPFSRWNWDDLYELIFVHAVEPKLPRDKTVVLMDYPAQVPCLAKDKAHDNSPSPLWKERWELYGGGIELANCYSEEIDALKVKEYFEREGALKEKTARVPHALDADYWKIFSGMTDFSGVAMGIDRLIALMTGSRAIESVVPFPL